MILGNKFVKIAKLETAKICVKGPTVTAGHLVNKYNDAILPKRSKRSIAEKRRISVATVWKHEGSSKSGPFHTGSFKVNIR